MDALSKQFHQAPVLRKDTDLIYLHSCDLNTKLDFQYLLCNFYGWLWASANSLLSVLWWRGGSICYRLTGEFWINSTAWDFYPLYHSLKRLWLYRLLKKLKTKLSFVFFFAGKGKLFIMQFFFAGDLIFFTAESAWPVLNCNQGSDVLENFEVHFLLYGQGNYVVKRIFINL